VFEIEKKDRVLESIVCHKNKSKPKVHVSVCNACKRRRSCEDYSRYHQPLLFPDPGFPGRAKKTRKKRACPKPAEPVKRQQQLAMKGILKSN